MNWADKAEKFGKPIDGQTYLCKIQHYHTKKIVEEVLVWKVDHDGDDGMFLTADDDSRIDHWNWDVIEWRIKE
jgi:hypothetical protein